MLRIPPALALAALTAGTAEANFGNTRQYFIGSTQLAAQAGGISPAGYQAPNALPPGAMPVNSIGGAVGQQVAPIPAAPTVGVAAVAGRACPTCVPGGTASANFGAGVPNQIVTFLHPYTNQAISVPLTLPVGKPTIVTKRDRIVYSYGLFRKVVVIFRPQGRVEVVYK